MNVDPRRLLRDMFDAAVARAMPDKCVPPFLPKPPKGRTLVVGAGKAAATMAKAVEDNWPGELTGLVVTRYGHHAPCRRIEVVEAAHPVPDQAGRQAAERILRMVQGLSADDLVLCLISGGGSALLSLPAPGLTLQDKQAINRALLKSGANIAEMNCVRKHLSAIKGGRLAAACHPAKVVTLTISDVPGDDPAVIASGPTVPDRTTFADALAILDKYGITEPTRVVAHSARSARRDAQARRPAPGRDRNPPDRRSPAVARSRRRGGTRVPGVTPVILGDSLEGESREVAMVHAGIARQVLRHGQPAQAPCVLLSGGETTVTVRGNGRGGRNVEFLLALAVALDGDKRVYALAGDTDGVDGTEDNAGAVVTPDTLARAAAAGLDAKSRLADNDGYSFFSALGDLVVTGPDAHQRERLPRHSRSPDRTDGQARNPRRRRASPRWTRPSWCAA